MITFATKGLGNESKIKVKQVTLSYNQRVSTRLRSQKILRKVVFGPERT